MSVGGGGAGAAPCRGRWPEGATLLLRRCRRPGPRNGRQSRPDGAVQLLRKTARMSRGHGTTARVGDGSQALDGGCGGSRRWPERTREHPRSTRHRGAEGGRAVTRCWPLNDEAQKRLFVVQTGVQLGRCSRGLRGLLARACTCMRETERRRASAASQSSRRRGPCGGVELMLTRAGGGEDGRRHEVTQRKKCGSDRGWADGGSHGRRREKRKR